MGTPCHESLLGEHTVNRARVAASHLVALAISGDGRD